MSTFQFQFPYITCSKNRVLHVHVGPLRKAIQFEFWRENLDTVTGQPSWLNEPSRALYKNHSWKYAF